MPYLFANITYSIFANKFKIEYNFDIYLTIFYSRKNRQINHYEKFVQSAVFFIATLF